MGNKKERLMWCFYTVSSPREFCFYLHKILFLDVRFVLFFGWIFWWGILCFWKDLAIFLRIIWLISIQRLVFNKLLQGYLHIEHGWSCSYTLGTKGGAPSLFCPRIVCFVDSTWCSISLDIIKALIKLS